jgi:hypothetical protein
MVMHLLGGFCWLRGHGVTILNLQENQYACNVETPVHSTEKPKSEASARKEMLTVFFEIEGPLFLEFNFCNDTVLHSTINKKRKVKLTVPSSCCMLMPVWGTEFRTN